MNLKEFLKLKLQNLPATKAAIIIIVGFLACLLLDLDLVIKLFFIIPLAAATYIISKDFKSSLFVSVCYCIGILLFVKADYERPAFPKKNIYPFEAVANAKILQEIKRTDKIQILLADAEIRSKYLNKKTRSRIMLSKLRDGNVLVPGDVIYFKSRLEAPLPKYFEGQFDERSYLISFGASFKAFIGRNYALIGHEKSIYYYQWKLAEAVRSKLRQLYNSKTYPFAAAVLIGDKTELDSDIKKSFALTGAAHLLAVSGLHVGLIALVAFFLTSYIRNRWISFAVFFVLITLFIVITGYQASGIRAGIMIILYQAMKLFQRRVEPLNVLSLSMILILIIDPLQIYSIGFQLSFLAMYGIFFFYKDFLEKLSKLNKANNTIIDYLLKSIAMTLSAGILTAPAVAVYFNTYSVVSPLANLLLVPLFSLSLIFILISYSFAFISIPIAGIYASASNFVIDASVYINKIFESQEFSYLQGYIAAPAAILTSSILIYLFYSNTRRKLVFRTIVSTAFLIPAIIYYPKPAEASAGNYDFRYVKYYYKKTAGDTLMHYIEDVRPHQYPKAEFELLERLKESYRPSILFYSGNCAMAYADEIKLLKNYKTFEIKHKEIKEKFK